jgi:hypothetical protein
MQHWEALARPLLTMVRLRGKVGKPTRKEDNKGEGGQTHNIVLHIHCLPRRTLAKVEFIFPIDKHTAEVKIEGTRFYVLVVYCMFH